jgi:hypothetical protein
MQVMLDAVEVKEMNGIPVLPETFASIEQLRRQSVLLAEDIAKRRKQIEDNAAHHQDNAASPSGEGGES